MTRLKEWILNNNTSRGYFIDMQLWRKRRDDIWKYRLILVIVSAKPDGSNNSKGNQLNCRLVSYV